MIPNTNGRMKIIQSHVLSSHQQWFESVKFQIVLHLKPGVTAYSRLLPTDVAPVDISIEVQCSLNSAVSKIFFQKLFSRIEDHTSCLKVQGSSKLA